MSRRHGTCYNCFREVSCQDVYVGCGGAFYSFQCPACYVQIELQHPGARQTAIELVATLGAGSYCLDCIRGILRPLPAAGDFPYPALPPRLTPYLTFLERGKVAFDLCHRVMYQIPPTRGTPPEAYLMDLIVAQAPPNAVLNLGEVWVRYAAQDPTHPALLANIEEVWQADHRTLARLWALMLTNGPLGAAEAAAAAPPKPNKLPEGKLRCRCNNCGHMRF